MQSVLRDFHLCFGSKELATHHHRLLHALLEPVDEDKISNWTTIGFSVIIGGQLPRFSILNISILKDTDVSLHVSRPDDLLPIVRRISPERALWIGLNSRSGL
jgi:hypothetical protein